jgi:kynureninase
LLPALHPRKEKSGYNRGMVLPSLTQDDALQRDAQDELAAFRERFYFEEAPPGSPCLIYLDGNSLGRLPLQTALAMEEVISNQWGRQLIRSWGQHWLAAPVRAGEAIAGLVGAAPGQVIVCDSTSINLYKLAMAALALRPGCSAIVSDQLNFPSDLYILQGCLETTFAGRASQPGSSQSLPELRLAPPAPGSGGSLPDLDALLAAIDEQVALVSLSQVAFKSGYLYDVAEITRQAHAAGALVLWDLSHSAGALPIELDAWDVDFAVGCTYKYLNGGPGAPAFLYVNRRLQDSAVSPIRGWFGQDQPLTPFPLPPFPWKRQARRLIALRLLARPEARGKSRLRLLVLLPSPWTPIDSLSRPRTNLRPGGGAGGRGSDEFEMTGEKDPQVWPQNSAVEHRTTLDANGESYAMVEVTVFNGEGGTVSSYEAHVVIPVTSANKVYGLYVIAPTKADRAALEDILAHAVQTLEFVQ